MRSKNGGDDGTGVYMREGTTSRVTVADRTYCKFYDFYSASPENFGSTHVHVSGDMPTQYQERIQLYLQHLVLVKLLLLPVTVVEKLELCSNFATIAAGSSNGLTSTRCSKYSCMRS